MIPTCISYPRSGSDYIEHRADVRDTPRAGLTSESGIVLCKDIDPNHSLSTAIKDLPEEYRDRFYGRESITIPHYIQLSGDGYTLKYD